MKIPLYQSTTERIMIAGLPRNIAIIGGTLAAAIVLGFQSLWAVPFIFIGYIILVLLYQKDLYFIEILLDHIKEDDYLFP
jgi:type IV secretory pathway TrbD component